MGAQGGRGAKGDDGMPKVPEVRRAWVPTSTQTQVSATLQISCIFL